MKANLTRKDFLKLGAALPLALSSLNLRATEKPKAAPKRLLFICNSLGFYKPNFFPQTRGDLSTSLYLKQMQTQGKMTLFQNLFHPGMETSNHDSEKSFLTGAPNPEAASFINTISLDQILARNIGGDTRYPSLSFSIYDRGWGCSWNSRGAAIPPMHDEELIFNKLFGKEDLAAKRQQITNDQTVLECLHRDMRHLKQTGSSASKLDSYRSVILELEEQLKHEEFWLTAKKPVVTNTLNADAEYPFSTKIGNLLELSKLAFQTDSTRVITLSMDWISGAIKAPGVTGGWHTLSHHGNNPEALEKLTRIESAITNNLDHFLYDLDQIQEDNGTLLDNTTVLIGSNFGDASNHTHNSLPLIIAGGGYKHQAHTVLDKPTPLCNLYLELLHRHNIDAGSFGGSDRDMGLLLG